MMMVMIKNLSMMTLKFHLLGQTMKYLTNGRR